MLKLNTIEFFKHGELPSYPFGMLRELVIANLGEPDWLIDNEESSLIRYANVEFYFSHHNKELKKLDGIVILPLEDDDSAEKVRIDCDWFSYDLNYEQVKSYLNTKNIDFVETVSDANNKDKIIKTSGNVSFLFFTEDLKICKAGRFLGIDETL